MAGAGAQDGVHGPDGADPALGGCPSFTPFWSRFIRPHRLAGEVPVAGARAILEGLGLTKYETDAYLALVPRGVADARTLCRAADIPTSKIYDAMARLEALGLVSVQPSRPRKFMAREPAEAAASLATAKRREFDESMALLPRLESELRGVAASTPKGSAFWSVALSWRDFAAQHLAKVAEAQKEHCAYFDVHAIGAEAVGMEPTDDPEGLEALGAMMGSVKTNFRARRINYRVLVGAATEAERDLARAWISAFTDGRNLNRYRFTEPGRQMFHCMDRDSVVLMLPNPAAPKRFLGSVYARDPALARAVAQAFDALWDAGTSIEG